MRNTTLTFQIGKNAVENTELIHRADDMDVWFHIKGVPSAHLIFSNSDSLDLEYLRKRGIIYRLALELKKGSKYRKSNNIEVIYSYVKDIKPQPKPGLVFCDSPKVIRV